MKYRTPFALCNVALLASLAGCAGMSGKSGMTATPSVAYSQAALPDAVRVPAGHKVALETVGAGRITYECREKAGSVGASEWVFVGPDASLANRQGKAIGKYYGPPATWESTDGSKLTGTQVAVAPAAAGNIPNQLVKANPAVGQGAMSGMTYIQRVNTMGGVPPALPCDAGSHGRKELVKYQADYIFYAAM